MKQSTGIVLNNLNNAQELSLLQLADVVFIRDDTVPSKIPQPIFSIHDLPYFKGKLITTNLDNTDLAMKAHGEFKINFIVWDLEWLRHPMNFSETVHIYRNVDILIARSQSHALAIQNYSNRKVNGYTKCG